eukprot:jgi/Ulvmu1/568/UM001_0576.1
MFATRVQVRTPVSAMQSRRTARVVPSAVIDDVQDVIADQMGLDMEKVTPDARFIEDLGADSLDTVEVMMALEEKFEVTIDTNIAENIRTVSDVADVVQKIQSGELTMPQADAPANEVPAGEEATATKTPADTKEA